MHTYTIDQVKEYYMDGLLSLTEAKQRSEAAGYSMFKMGGKFVWFKK